MLTSRNIKLNSFGSFPTTTNYRSAVQAGEHLCEMLEQDDPNVFWREIVELKGQFDQFYAWFWVQSPRYGIRAIVEIRPETGEAILIAVRPKERSEDHLLALWNNNRTLRRKVYAQR